MNKILYNNMIIDVLEKITYCKCLTSGRTLRTDKTSANCIVSSDGSQMYAIKGTSGTPDTYKKVEIIPIDKKEYDYLTSLIIPDNPIPDADILAEQKASKIAEINNVCHQKIIEGFDITLSSF